MKKIIMIILSFIIMNEIFAGIKDETNTFDFKAIRRIDRSIEKIESSKKIKIYINIFDGEESFHPEDPQRTVIFDIQKINKDEISVELKFSEDLNLENKSVELSAILDNYKKELYEGKYEEYIVGVLDSIDKVLASEEAEEKEIEAEENIEK
ncbi:hypothetical protein [Fusobacterium sp.]|uniref:hypothetical protein n=1 Tax=Fusobacterium sp. TaxID=68766 RepID=UPI002627F00E|nr:hypothetical protein [Fusobacterium sp.]